MLPAGGSRTAAPGDERRAAETRAGNEWRGEVSAAPPSSRTDRSTSLRGRVAMVNVYVSYAWKDEEQHRLVDRLGTACKARGIDFVRDTSHVGYGGSIREFMNRLAAAGHVVVVFSDRYLRSRYCLYELREIWRNGHFRARVSPIVLRGTSLRRGFLVQPALSPRLAAARGRRRVPVPGRASSRSASTVTGCSAKSPSRASRSASAGSRPAVSGWVRRRTSQSGTTMKCRTK